MAERTREEWLETATELMREWFSEERINKPLPEKVRVSTGYGKRASKNAIGVCYTAEAAEDAIHQIFISPEITDPVKVLSTLLHELVHAADNGVSGHTGEFKRVAKALGLTGKMTATVPGDELSAALTNIVDKLGEYGHAKLNPMSKVGKQSTRMIKVEALCCGYIVRTTRKWLEIGIPACPCGNEMEVAV